MKRKKERKKEYETASERQGKREKSKWVVSEWVSE